MLFTVSILCLSVFRTAADRSQHALTLGSHFDNHALSLHTETKGTSGLTAVMSATCTELRLYVELSMRGTEMCCSPINNNNNVNCN